MSLTQENLKSLIDYNPETGKALWKTREVKNKYDKTWNTRYAGNEITSKNNYGYIVCSIHGKRYLLHRLVYTIMTGKVPKNQVDHINGDKTDNRWCNLRDATHAENCRNVKTNKNKTGYRGVSKLKGRYKHNPYRADICKDGVMYRLGYYSTAKEAHDAYLKAAEELHGDFYFGKT